MQKSVTEIRHRDVYSMLIEMDKLFGKHFNGETPAFSLYGPYEGDLGVIFPVRTDSFVTENTFDLRIIKRENNSRCENK